MRLLASIIGLSLLGSPVLAKSVNATVDLCNKSFSVRSSDGTDITKMMQQTDHCKNGGKLNVTIDLCKNSPRLYGFGNHDKNAFTQNTGQC